MKRLTRLENIALGILLLSMTAFSIIQVVTRYIFKIPLPWIEELTRYLMIWMVFIASALAVNQRAHLKVDIFELILSKKKFCYLNIGVQCLIVLFALFFVVAAFQFLRDQLSAGQVSPAMQVSMAWPLTALLVGGLLMVVQGVYLVYRLLMNKVEHR